MVAPLNKCASREQCGFVQFLWPKGMVAKDIHQEILLIYREHCLSRQAVRNWVQKFSERRTSIEDEHRVGRPVEIATPAKNFTPLFPAICETVGQVFKFVWRLW
jgi:hypothetical protein